MLDSMESIVRYYKMTNSLPGRAVWKNNTEKTIVTEQSF